VIDVLRRKGYCITEENIREGLRNVEWPVRFQIMQEHPLFILDGGHNPQCIEAVRDSLKALLPEGIRLVILTGILKGKDAQGMVEILSDLTKDFVLTSPDSYRARPAEELLELADRCGCHAVVCPDSGEAVRTAIELAGPDGAVCCIGSLYLAGEVLDLFRRKSSLSEAERI
jgi:dihydrofolate synthase/folylpolyglutamate synthase